MQCSRCRHENPAGVKFCGECGARLESSCPACHAANPPANKFCHQCGGPLPAGPGIPTFPSPESYTPKQLAERILTSRAALEGERKQVTEKQEHHEHFATATALYRDMSMTYWLEQAEMAQQT